MPRLDADAEILWTASVLAQYKAELREFTSRREEFYASYLRGELTKAQSLLQEIEALFGISIWLLNQRLQILQLLKGLKAQKDLLEEVVTTPGFSQYAAWLVYYFSVRAEENVSYTSLEQQAGSIIDIPELGDYWLSHVLPYDLTQIENIGIPIAQEEPNPIIDRYETFVSMLQLYATRVSSTSLHRLKLALEQLDGVADVRITRLQEVFGLRKQGSVDATLPAADSYTVGRYDLLLPDTGDNLELIARSAAIAEIEELGEVGFSIKSQIVRLMADILVRSDRAAQSRLTLKKLALLCSKHGYGIQIAAFLERRHEHLQVSEYTELDRLAAIAGPIDNPWSAPILSQLTPDVSWLDRLSVMDPQSPSIRLRQALSNKSNELLEALRGTVPEYRFNSYAGHIAFSNSDYDVAADFYRKVRDTGNDYLETTATRYLFESHYAVGRYEDAMTIAVAELLRKPTAWDSYPLERLTKLCLKDHRLISRVELAILVYLTSRHIDPKWERELSDIYENVLDNLGFARPSEITDTFFDAGQPDHHLWIFFLRNIAIPRVLDDTTAFDDVDAVDQERISVLQILNKADPEHGPIYLAEIRTITRDLNVAHFLKKVQSSKIYVDESGVRRALEVTLKESFARYERLLSFPALAYQAEKLTKRLVAMLNVKGSPELKELKLPASELEGLVQSMLSDTVHEFALNPAFGLDTHISTSIRHGSFEGHLRSPLALENLLCARVDGDYALPAVWRDELYTLAQEEVQFVRKQLGRFTQRFEELVQSYTKQKLHIRAIGDNVAMFNYHSSEGELVALEASVAENPNYELVVDKLIAYCWFLTDRSLDAIRMDLQTSMRGQLTIAFDVLVTNLESKLRHDQIVSMIDAVARARVSLDSALHDVIEWFHKPTDLSREPFEFDLAVHVAMLQATNCYTQTSLVPTLNLAATLKIPGASLDGLCELVFILFQNAIIHGLVEDGGVKVKISTSRREGSVLLECRNLIPEDVDLAERRATSDAAMRRYERDSALKRARSEGGSGLSKIWRIAEFDLRVKHSIELEVTNEREFVAKVELRGEAVDEC
ncbi:hypothetical protein P9250_32470 [Caballeronia sp. LP006]|uniref:hypothetical protein n=1 Tax=Caballeronia sp. LP006 TaxID=3038552 RepID=UPI00285EBEBA|nr:hypothetical protein [Caballeronia sp. LP006]MDR5832565.1 hypothetical protein [Caballeronia sp. LP006]